GGEPGGVPRGFGVRPGSGGQGRGRSGMSVRQISVFLESRPGHLRRVLDAFVAADVSVRGYCASDTGYYGIVRFVVDDPERAMGVLKNMGAAATASEVLCLRLADEPGELARVMGVMADCGVNVTYSYS